MKYFGRIKRSVFVLETGRYSNIYPKNRLWKKCTLEKGEDEQHCLLECTNYTKLK